MKKPQIEVRVCTKIFEKLSLNWASRNVKCALSIKHFEVQNEFYRNCLVTCLSDFSGKNLVPATKTWDQVIRVRSWILMALWDTNLLDCDSMRRVWVLSLMLAELVIINSQCPSRRRFAVLNLTDLVIGYHKFDFELLF